MADQQVAEVVQHGEARAGMEGVVALVLVGGVGGVVGADHVDGAVPHRLPDFGPVRLGVVVQVDVLAGIDVVNLIGGVHGGHILEGGHDGHLTPLLQHPHQVDVAGHPGVHGIPLHARLLGVVGQLVGRAGHLLVGVPQVAHVLQGEGLALGLDFLHRRIEEVLVEGMDGAVFARGRHGPERLVDAMGVQGAGGGVVRIGGHLLKELEPGGAGLGDLSHILRGAQGAADGVEVHHRPLLPGPDLLQIGLQGVGHGLDIGLGTDHGDAAVGRGHGTGVEVLLLGQAGVPQVAVAVDEAGQHVPPRRVDDSGPLQLHVRLGQHGNLLPLHAHIQPVEPLLRIHNTILDHQVELHGKTPFMLVSSEKPARRRPGRTVRQRRTLSHPIMPLG